MSKRGRNYFKKKTLIALEYAKESTFDRFLFAEIVSIGHPVQISDHPQSNSAIKFCFSLSVRTRSVTFQCLSLRNRLFWYDPRIQPHVSYLFFLLPSRCYLWKQLDARDFHFIMIPKYKWKQTYCAIKWTFDIVVKCFSGNVIHWEQYFTNKTEKIK